MDNHSSTVSTSSGASDCEIDSDDSGYRIKRWNTTMIMIIDYPGQSQELESASASLINQLESYHLEAASEVARLYDIASGILTTSGNPRKFIIMV